MRERTHLPVFHKIDVFLDIWQVSQVAAELSSPAFLLLLAFLEELSAVAVIFRLEGVFFVVNRWRDRCAGV
jgi:hypothetical protein